MRLVHSDATSAADPAEPFPVATVSGPGGDTAAPERLRRVAVASFIGTAIEFYDFYIYGTAAALVLNQAFFPTLDPVNATLASFSTYAVRSRRGLSGRWCSGTSGIGWGGSPCWWPRCC